MSKTWIVVADASRARIFMEENPGADWTLLEEFDFPDGRKKVADLVSDQPGSVRQIGAGGGKAGMEPRTDPHEKEAIRFARTLAEHLEKGRTQNAYDQLVLAAPAHFLGLMRKTLDKPTSKLVVHSSEHDYTHASLEEVQGRVTWER